MSVEQLAIDRTKLANQRTYLAYMRTGLAISAISGIFKKMWVLVFGVIVIIVSSVQYAVTTYKLNNNQSTKSVVFEYMPLVYSALATCVIYMQFKHTKGLRTS